MDVPEVNVPGVPQPADQEQDQEHREQQARDTGRRPREAAKPKHAHDQRYDEAHDRPVEPLMAHPHPIHPRHAAGNP